MATEEAIAAWRRITASLHAMSFHDRESIFVQGDQLPGLFCLLSGAVRLSHVTNSGRQLTIAVLGPDRIFGTALTGKTASCDATALGDVRLVRLTSSDIARLLQNEPPFALFLNGELETARERAERKLIDRETKSVEMRVVETLSELALTFGAPCAHGYSLEIPLTQQDIADLVHATRPVIAKIMNALRRKGALDYRRDLICVNDAALRAAHLANLPSL